MRPVGELLREWRNRRRLSQLKLAVASGVSTRHLSFVESGRSRPSREQLLHLAASLEVPLRERSGRLLAAGFSPAYPEYSLHAPQMAAVRHALDQLLRAHEPFPAVALDRHWDLVLANSSVLLLVERVADELLQPPINVMRATRHRDRLASRIVNFDEYSSHLLDRLRRQIFLTGDPTLEDLLRELAAYPGVRAGSGEGHLESSDVVLSASGTGRRSGRSSPPSRLSAPPLTSPWQLCRWSPSSPPTQRTGRLVRQRAKFASSGGPVDYAL
jgi:transcriptional regulator with XRE-family HTH domain